MTCRHPNVANLDEIELWAPPAAGPPPFGATVKRLAAATGGKKLGCNLFMVPAGRTAVPLHAHLNNEEAIFVVEGSGTLRIGKDRVPIHKGDYIALPSGEECAHQLIADRGEPLSYLVVSTMNDADVVTYPDSGKLMAAVGMSLGGAGIRKMFRVEDGNVDYWAGEGDKS